MMPINLMVTIDSGIIFDIPETWERSAQGGGCVFQTPRHEVIMVSAKCLSGDGSTAEYAAVMERLFANGLEAVRLGASHHDLKVTKQLREESGVCALRCATVLAETHARDAFYGQAVIQHSRGVVFLTYEAPFVEGAEHGFRDLLRMVREGGCGSKK